MSNLSPEARRTNLVELVGAILDIQFEDCDIDLLHSHLKEPTPFYVPYDHPETAYEYHHAHYLLVRGECQPGEWVDWDTHPRAWTEALLRYVRDHDSIPF
jgi:hypothetical protein